MFLNWIVTDQYNKTAVVLAHDAEQAIERAYQMYLMRGVKAALYTKEGE